MNERSRSRVLIVIPTLMLGLTLMQGSTCQAQANKQRGATVGGLIGAAVGGLIGDNNGEAGAGAAIGGVVTALKTQKLWANTVLLLNGDNGGPVWCSR